MNNRAYLRGYVAEEPFIRATESGKLAKLRVATTEKIMVQKSGAIREHIEWHTVILWGEDANLADEKICIGTAIEVEGALRTRDWEDSKGKLHRTTEIIASRIEILDGGVEGCDIPRLIAEKMETLYPQRRVESSAKFEVKAPTDDPDNLPF